MYFHEGKVYQWGFCSSFSYNNYDFEFQHNSTYIAMLIFLMMLLCTKPVWFCVSYRVWGRFYLETHSTSSIMSGRNPSLSSGSHIQTCPMLWRQKEWVLLYNIPIKWTLSNLILYSCLKPWQWASSKHLQLTFAYKCTSNFKSVPCY